MNLRFALRQLSRTPGYTALAVLTLAVGIGVNTALYTLIDSVVRRPVTGVGESSTLVWIGSTWLGRTRPAGISLHDADRIRAELPLIEDLAVARQMSLSIATPSGPFKVEGLAVSGNYFRTLRTRFALGRAFTWAEDSAAVTRPVIVLSHHGWQQYFGADSSIIGQAVMLNGVATTVVGVAEAGFNGAEHEELQRVAWVPMNGFQVLSPDWWKWMTTDATSSNLRAIARLRSLSDQPRVDAALAHIASVVRAADTARADGWTLKTYDASSGLPAGGEVAIRPVTILAFTVTGLILLICCANVANLALARAIGRQREIATRLSLGASRGRVVRQLLAESLVVSTLASVVGLFIATWSLDLLLRFALPPLGLDVSLDLRMFLASVALGVTTAILFGLAPALHATRDGVATVLRSGATGGSRQRARLQSSLVVAQVALSLTLLTLSGLLIRAVDRVLRVDVGLDASHRVLAVSFDVGLQRYDSVRTARFIDQLLQRTRALPGVENATTTTFLPLYEWSSTTVTVDRPGEPSSTRARPTVLRSWVARDYFRTLAIPLKSGRDFTDDDLPGTLPVAIVSESFVRKQLTGLTPLGTRISTNGVDGPWYTIVGVVADAAATASGGSASAAVYLPWQQTPLEFATSLLVRSSRGDAAALAPAIRGIIRDLDPLLPVHRQMTMDQLRAGAMKNERVGATVLAIFGALALLLASVGLYGALLFTVRQRTREIGIRVALGATRAAVIRLFLGRGLRLTSVGIVIGLALALATTQLIRGFLIGMSALDATTFVSVAVLFAGVALLASWLPARRAALVDPVITMRVE